MRGVFVVESIALFTEVARDKQSCVFLVWQYPKVCSVEHVRWASDEAEMKILSTGGLSYNADCRQASCHLSLTRFPTLINAYLVVKLQLQESLQHKPHIPTGWLYCAVFWQPEMHSRAKKLTGCTRVIDCTLLCYKSCSFCSSRVSISRQRTMSCLEIQELKLHEQYA